MAELNGSSYYRANPFYQQGYIPDMAYKNRKLPSYMVEIPQGQQFFQPSNKKHFQRLGYYSTIGDQHIMDPDKNNSSPRDKQHFSNLNVQDIEGANTNTLISKAVKNRMKAKEYLVERERMVREEESRVKMRKYEQREEERKHIEALSKMNRQKQPNYHEKIMKLRTEESQRNSPPQPKKVEGHERQFYRQRPTQRPQQQMRPAPQAERQRHQRPVGKNYHEDQYESYRQQLQRTERQIRQLQSQLRQSRQIKHVNEEANYRQKVQNHHHSVSQSDKNHYLYQQDSRHEEVQKNIVPQTYHQENLSLPQNRKVSMPEQQYRQEYNQQEAYRAQNASLHRPNQRGERNQNRNYRNFSGTLQPPNKMRSFTNHQPQIITQQETREPEPERLVASPIYDHRNQIRQTREQHRRINPTYLSFGSAAIGLAGRNIVGS